VTAFTSAIDACVEVQLPGKDGKIDDRGQCPPVSVAIRERKDAEAVQPHSRVAGSETAAKAAQVPPAVSPDPVAGQNAQ
jgi:hypothetical protein